MTHQYDWLVIGGGSAGLAAAQMAASLGKTVILFEPDRLGGTCVHRGCVPKKMFWYLSDLVQQADLFEGYALRNMAHGVFDYPAFSQRLHDILDNLQAHYQNNLAKSGITWVKEKAVFQPDGHIHWQGQPIHAQHTLICTGGRPIVPTIHGAEHAFTSNDFFNLKEIPTSAVFIGSGYIALELASSMATLQRLAGYPVDVCVVARSDRFLRHMDAAVVDELTAQMITKGIRLITEHRIEKLERSDKKISAVFDQQTLNAAAVFMAVGRAPNTALHLERIGVRCEDKGFIAVDDAHQTHATNVFAIGDVINKPQLTPVAVQAARRLVQRVAGNDIAGMCYDNIPTVIFTHPPLAKVGLSEQEARAQYTEVKIYTAKFTPLKYSFAKQKQDSMIKLICAGCEQKVVGLVLLGESSDEMLQGFALALQQGLTKQQWDRGVAIHPTIAEEVVTLKPIHF